jgi:hypothetical protein
MTRKLCVFVLLLAGTASGTIFGTVRGLIHDPQHRPVAGATVVLKSNGSEWTKSAQSDSDGSFQFEAVPAGGYTVTVTVPGFETPEQTLVIQSGGVANLHFPLAVARVSTNVEVHAEGTAVDTGSSTTTTTIERHEILQTPGADRSNSVSMITDYVPGAYVVHDQLHIRGGHQFSWLLDGVPVPNTNIATNVGPQFDPRDIDTLEVQRGGL